MTDDQLITKITELIWIRHPRAGYISYNFTNNVKCTAGGEPLWFATADVQVDIDMLDMTKYEGDGMSLNEAVRGLLFKLEPGCG